MGVPPPADRHCLPTFSVSIRPKLRPSNTRACTSLTFVFGGPRPRHSKQARAESSARIANQNSLVGFLKAIVSDEAVTVEYRTAERGLNDGINRQYEIRRNTVGRSPPRSLWPARTVHVRRYARARTAGRPLFSSWMRAMSGATADRSGVRPASGQGAPDDHRLAKPTRLGARPGPVVGIRRRRRTGVVARLSRTRSAAAF